MSVVNNPISQPLLTPGMDPEPIEVLNTDSVSPFLLVCEHAGQAIPLKLGSLGLPNNSLDLHIGYDIGAEQVSRGLAEKLHSLLILQRYSRLVIDCNRQPGTPSSIPEMSDSNTIPGNIQLSNADRQQREQSIFAPYAEQCKLAIALPRIAFTYSIHSFTPLMAGLSRPWDIGFLYRHPSSGGDALAALCQQLWPDLTIGLNQPYAIEDLTDWFIPICAEPRGIPHCLIEIKNDHLLTAEGCKLWSSRLSQLFTTFKEQSYATVS